MPWRSRREGGLTSYRFGSAHPLLGALGSVFFLAVFGTAGLVLVGLGLEDLTVTCEREPRDPAPICRVTEGYLLGAFPVVRNAVGTQAVRLVENDGGRSARLRLEIDSKQGVLEVPAVDVGGVDDPKRLLASSLDAWLKGSEPRFELSQRLLEPLAAIGIPFVLLALQLVLTVFFGLFGSLLAPPTVEVDERRRALRVRAFSFGRLREIRFEDLAAVEASESPGALVAQTAQARKQLAVLARFFGLHLHFVLKDGERVVFRNRWRLSREDVIRLRDELASEAGVPAR